MTILATTVLALVGLTQSNYLELVDHAVNAYSAQHLEGYLADAERDGVQEHGFPRLTANLAMLVANGRANDRRDTLKRMLNVCCRDAAKGTMPPKSGGNEFSVKELVEAVVALERAKVYDKAITDGWRAVLTQVQAEKSYTLGKLKTGDSTAHNWVVFAAASEQARIAHGMGGDAKFVERYVADQLRFFDANGMYKDPNQPMVYDFVTRLQFALILHYGYNGPSRAKLEEMMDKSAEPTLKMLSVNGEIPYGGRSNQFLHNNTFYAALSEWYARRQAARGDQQMAGRFRAAAARAVAALKPWLDMQVSTHVKNCYPRQTGASGFSMSQSMGCESYAYFDKYMVTMGSWALLGYIFADERIAAVDDSCASVESFATTRDFHMVIQRAGNYSLQYDYAADSHYDCDGLGRLERKGAPTALCLATPCAHHSNYRIERENEAALSIAPVVEGVLALLPVDSGAKGDSAVSSWRVEGRDDLLWKCALSNKGWQGELTGKGKVALSLPAFEFDGKTATKVMHTPKEVSVEYAGWKCVYWTDGIIEDSGKSMCNRNGRYRCFIASGIDSVKVSVSIERTKSGVALFQRRLSTSDTKSMDTWRRTLKSIADNPESCDEVWFSTGCALPNMEWHRQHAEILRQASADMRKLGIRPSIQVQATIGHSDKIGKGSEKMFVAKDWTGWTDHTGLELRFCSCPRQPKFLEYMRQMSAIYAELKLESAWIDDDMRMNNHSPADNEAPFVGCWCKTCIGEFNAETKGDWTRETLSAAIKDDAKVAAAWRKFSIASICQVGRVIAEAFHKVAPKTMMAYQSCSSENELDVAPAVLKTLHEATGAKVGYRPGSGAYYDLNPVDLFCRAIRADWFRKRIGNPEYVAEWTPEIESYPRTYYSRTAQGVGVDMFSALMRGMNRLSYYIFNLDKEPDELYERHFWEPLAEMAPMIRAYAEANEDTRAVGIGVHFDECPANYETKKIHDPKLFLTGVPIVTGLGETKALFNDEDLAFEQLWAKNSRQVQEFRDRIDERAGKLPAKLETPYMGMMLPRVNAKDELRTVALMSAVIDTQYEITLKLRQVPANAKRAVWHELRRADVDLELRGVGSEREVTVPSIGAWNCGFIEFK